MHIANKHRLACGKVFLFRLQSNKPSCFQEGFYIGRSYLPAGLTKEIVKYYRPCWASQCSSCERDMAPTFWSMT